MVIGARARRLVLQAPAPRYAPWSHARRHSDDHQSQLRVVVATRLAAVRARGLRSRRLHRRCRRRGGASRTAAPLPLLPRSPSRRRRHHGVGRLGDRRASPRDQPPAPDLPGRAHTSRALPFGLRRGPVRLCQPSYSTADEHSRAPLRLYRLGGCTDRHRPRHDDLARLPRALWRSVTYLARLRPQPTRCTRPSAHVLQTYDVSLDPIARATATRCSRTRR